MADPLADEYTRFKARLRALRDDALELRMAGILKISVDGLEVTLAPYQEPMAAGDAEKSPKPPADPLLDPHTYGLPEGSPVPGISSRFTINKDAPSVFDGDDKR